MEKRITSVQWSATGLPAGLSFNTATGTFSGTPSEAGDYTVPVMVKTNYGQDSKNVIINVEGGLPAYPVYAIGQNAETWSENAEADENGFRKLNMPNSIKLTSLIGYKIIAFGAKTRNGTWYVCGNRASFFTYFDKNINVLAPIELPIEGIVDMVGGYNLVSSTPTNVSALNRLLCRLKNNEAIVITETYTITTSGSSKTTNTSSTSVNINNVIHVIPYSYTSMPCYTFYDKNNEGKIAAGTASIYSVEISKIDRLVAHGTPCYFSTEGELFMYVTTNFPSYLTKNAEKLPGFARIDFDFDKIKQVYFTSDISFFCLTYDNELYAIGSNSYYELSLPKKQSYTTFTKVGDFDVKTIQVYNHSTFLLTENGDLYHSGDAISGVTEQHNSFTKIFPQYIFRDIAVSSTLIALIEE